MKNNLIEINNIFKNEDSKSKFLNEIISTSKHKQTAITYLNLIASEYPEYKNLIYNLSIYPLSKWSSVIRKEIQIDIDSLHNSIVNCDNSYFGFGGINSMATQYNSLKFSEQFINIVDQIIEGKLPIYNSDDNEKIVTKSLSVFKAIHSCNPNDESSKFLINEYYKDCILSVCRLYNNIFQQNYNDFLNFKNKLDDDIEFVTHNTEMLVKLYKNINRINRYDQINIEEFKKTFMLCVSSITKYPIGGEELYEILLCYLNGENELSMANKLNRSRTYVRSKFKKSLKILSFLIWGESSN